MHGNVEEACEDWKGDYSADAATDPKGPEGGSDRVYRGGDWGNDGRFSRAAHRGSCVPSHRTLNQGVRLVRAVP